MPAKPSKHNATALDQRVAALAHPMAQCAASGLGRGFDALARHVELPAMKGTAQTIAFVAAKGQVSASVRAIAVEQTVVALRVAKQHQVLPQNAHRLDGANRHARIERGVEFVHQGDGLPVVAHHRAARRARPDAGDQLVLFCFHVCLRTAWSVSDRCMRQMGTRLSLANQFKPQVWRPVPTGDSWGIA